MSKKTYILSGIVVGIGLLAWMGFFTWLYEHNYYVESIVNKVIGKR